MADQEVYLNDNWDISNSLTDEIENRLLNVTIIQEEESFDNSIADVHSLQILDAPIVDGTDNFEVPITDEIQTETLPAPEVHEVVLSDNFNIPLTDDLSNFILNAPIVDGTDNFNVNIVDSFDSELLPAPPKILEIRPSGSIYSQYPYFYVKVVSALPCKIDFVVTDSDNSEVFKVLNQDMELEESAEFVNYYRFELDFVPPNYDFLLFDDYTIKVKVYSTAGEDNEEVDFSILEDTTEIVLDKLEKDFSKNLLWATFRIKNRNESWITLYPILTNERYQKDLKIVDFEGGKGFIKDSKVLFIKTTEEFTSYKIAFQFSTETEYSQIAPLLNSKLLKISYKVLVLDLDGKEYDITDFLTNVSYNYSTELSSRQANFSFVYHPLLCPYTNTNTPLFYGNKVIFKTILSLENEDKEFIEYIGYIKSVDTENETINVVALDKLSKFSQKLNEDLYYSPNKITVTEYLKTLDGIKFKSTHKGWAELPAPKVYVNGKMKKVGEYVVDYYRGEVYLSSNPYLDPEWVEQIVDMNEVDDRKTIELYGNINLSSDLKVKWTYMQKEDYSCVNGVDSEEVWIEKTVSLIYGVDYTIDYENKELILRNPIPEDTETVRNHYIVISYRKDVEPVMATYSYYEPGTNEVEHITEDLAKRLGFTEEDLIDEHEEYVITRDGYNFMTKYKNIKEVLEFKIDSQDSNDYMIVGGQIQTKYFYPTNETLIDGIESAYFFRYGENCSAYLDFEDKIFGDYSVVVSLSEESKWFSKKYGSTNSGLDLSRYREVAIYLKPDRDVTLNVSLLTGEGLFVTGENFDLVGNQWNKVVLDISEANITYKRKVGYLKVVTNEVCNIKVDYLHVPSHSVYIRYKYGTLQPTGVSINEVWFNKGETDSYLDVLQEIYKQVDPSYVLYIDKQEKLRGEYKKLIPYYLLPIFAKYNRVEFNKMFGGLMIPDYPAFMLSNFSHSISEEQLYSAVMVIGRLSQKANVALLGQAEDRCAVIEGSPYIRTTYYVPKTGAYAVDEVLAEMLEKQGIDPLPAPERNAKTVIDSNSESGMFWYVKKDNDASRPFSNEELMLTITLPEPVKWEEINVLVGIYKNYVIREELYIEVETEEGERFYPEENYPSKKQGQSGTWLRWTNKRFKNKKIKKVHVYCSEAARWITSKQVVGGGKK